MSAEGARPRGEAQETDEAPRSWLGRQLEGVQTLLVAILIALGIRTFLIEPFRIPSESMLPTLVVGDHLFVNKFVYGVAIPGTGIRLPAVREPRRGDVVVFTVARGGPSIYPADERPSLPQEEFVKRIVALPGDRVAVRGGRVLVNGEEVSQERLGRFQVDDQGRRLRLLRARQNGCTYRVLDDPRMSGLTQATMTVPAGRFFVMGDNRDHSNDSRNWGTVRLEEIKGPAFVLYWSWDFNGSWLELANPVTWWDLLVHRTRWGRIGDGVGCEREAPAPDG